MVVSGVTTYQSSRLLCGGQAPRREAVYQTGRPVEWWDMSKGVGEKRGSRVTN